MRKSYRRNALILAANTALLTPIWQHGAHANSYTWVSTSSPTWTASANWNGGTTVPGAGDAAIFTTAHVPPGHSVTIPSDVSVGAIIENLASTASLTIDGTSSNVTLNGLNVSVPYYNNTTFTGSNVIIAATSSSNSTSGKFLTLGSGLTLHLANPQNIVVGAAGSATKTGSSININSNIVDGNNGPAALTYYGNGNFAAGGGALNLAGSNTFSGGMIIGSADGLNGGQVGVVANANLGTGSIVVNDQGQLIFNANGVYGTPDAPGQPRPTAHNKRHRPIEYRRQLRRDPHGRSQHHLGWGCPHRLFLDRRRNERAGRDLLNRLEHHGDSRQSHR